MKKKVNKKSKMMSKKRLKMKQNMKIYKMEKNFLKIF